MTHRILVIDDEKAVLNYLKVTLTQDGRFDVEILDDSRQGFRKIDSGKYDLILLDMDMPHVTGKEILENAIKKGLIPTEKRRELEIKRLEQELAEEAQSQEPEKTPCDPEAQTTQPEILDDIPEIIE